MNFRLYVVSALAFSLALAGCSGARHMTPQTGGIMLDTPQSVSPGSIAPAPMAHTAILPASVMAVKPQSAIQGASWTQIPGAASYAAAAPDGSLWVLSTAPSGADKSIWHYVSGTWTNISGLAMQLAVAPNGTLYAVNSGGGTYSYSGGTWTALGGGASNIATVADGSFYVLSNGGPGPDRAIWHNVNGAWLQVPGSGTSIAGSFDTATYTGPGGTISPGGFYVLNSQGSIYYGNTGGSFVQLPANASAIAPTTIGGVIALGYPANAGGNSLYYYNLNSPGWSALSGSAIGISSGAGNLYAIGSSGAIYTSPVNVASTAALKIINNNPAIPSSSINVYVYGQVPGSAPAIWQYVTANGSTVAMTSNGANITPIPFGSSGSTSQTIFLPPMTSCRIYIVGGTFNFNIPVGAPAGAGPNNPAPWTNDGSQNLYFDFVEYTWNPPGAMNVDTSQVDGFNLAMSVTLTGSSTSTFGFLGGAVTQLHNAVAGYGGQWATLNAQWPYRVTNPGHGDQSSFFTDSTFLDSVARTAWDTYKTQFMTLDLTGAGFSTYYGQVDGNENFNFYTTPSTSGTLVGTIVSPFSAANVAMWGSPTMQILTNSGAFSNVPSGQSAGLVLAIGSRVVGALNRGTFTTLLQPACSVAQYPGAAYQNQYANALHAVANQPQYGYGGAYAFAYDDSCATSTDTSQTSPTSMTIQINPS